MNRGYAIVKSPRCRAGRILNMKKRDNAQDCTPRNNAAKDFKAGRTFKHGIRGLIATVPALYSYTKAARHIHQSNVAALDPLHTHKVRLSALQSIAHVGYPEPIAVSEMEIRGTARKSEDGKMKNSPSHYSPELQYRA